MRRQRGSRLSTGRTDTNGRASVRRRRRETQLDWAPPQEAFDFGPAEEVNRYTRAQGSRIEEAEAGNEGLDGLHPEKA